MTFSTISLDSSLITGSVPLFQTFPTAGFSISCSPCPKGTYAFQYATTANAAATTCAPCPFAANCSAGNIINAAPSFWGYALKSNPRKLVDPFILLPSGFGCDDPASCQSTSVGACSPDREGVLCGRCKTGLRPPPILKSLLFTLLAQL